MEDTTKNAEKIDLTKYPEGVNEIIRHMDFMPDNEEARKALFWGMVASGLFY